MKKKLLLFGTLCILVMNLSSCIVREHGERHHHGHEHHEHHDDHR